MPALYKPQYLHFQASGALGVIDNHVTILFPGWFSSVSYSSNLIAAIDNGAKIAIRLAAL